MPRPDKPSKSAAPLTTAPQPLPSPAKKARRFSPTPSSSTPTRMSKVDDDRGTAVEESTEEGSGSKKGKEIVLFQSGQVNDGSDSYFAKNVSHLRPSSSLSKAHSPVETFAVLCSLCLKWRLIPSKERYEEIRERILDVPFVCKTAGDWKDGVSCDDTEDIHPDDSRVWAIDRPNIARTPPGWERLITIRAAGSTRFADVYYLTPKGKKLRSLNETQKHLEEHPEYGVIISQFSFQTPRPLQEDYVRKRPQSRAATHNSMGQATFENDDAQPISWAIPDRCTDLSLCPPQFSGSYYQESNAPRKKQKIKSLKKKGYGKIDHSQNHPYGSNFMNEM